MIKYLVQRPIAVIMTFIILIITGFLMIKQVPVSLLPNVDVPQIIIRINYPNNSSAVIEQNIIQPIRESLINLDNLKNIECISTNHIGKLTLTFEFGAKMNLAYIEVNEKLDQLINSLPRDMQRPEVIRVNTSDIPILRIQVTSNSGVDQIVVSTLVEKVLKKRLEQISGVSMVDINGIQNSIITVTPNKNILYSLKLNENHVLQTIKDANNELGALSIKQGQYSYFVKVKNELDNVETIKNLPIRLDDGTVIPLYKVANVQTEQEKQTGYHFYNGKEGLVITVQKQPESRMNDLMPQILNLVENFKIDYPTIDFHITQNQSFLLDAGINNLVQDLFCGGILTILILFLFLGNWAIPSLMSISIPLSLIITFIFFYLFNISFNIISLSGLTLGIGMLIDNSIVVIDNITRKRRSGLNSLDSSIKGVNEMIAPVISQVLTTVAVYAPLILLSGLSGTLVYDQAIGLTISLGVSLLVAFILVPLLYKLFITESSKNIKEDTIFYKWIEKCYHKMIIHILKFKKKYFILTLIFMPIGICLATKVPISALPNIEKKETLISVNWNASIDAQENLRRIHDLYKSIENNCLVVEADIGIQQFLFQQEDNSIEQSEIYYACKNEKNKNQTDEFLIKWLKVNYPKATWKITDAPNAFTQLFNSTKPYFEARFKPLNKNEIQNEKFKIQNIINNLMVNNYSLGAGLIFEPSISILLDYEKMSVYGINKSSIEEALKKQFGTYIVSEINRFGEIKKIKLKTDLNTIDIKLENTINSINGSSYPLKYFITYSYDEQYKFITSDKTGQFKSIKIDNKLLNFPKLMENISAIAIKNGFIVNYDGQYFENNNQIKELSYIFLIVLILLYFILTIQYEDLIQPLIVMLTIPIGISGGMILLWFTGGTLDVMAAIGFVVILGLIVDDPILKVETLIKLEKKHIAQGKKFDNELLEYMIHEAGSICLKPLLMVSLTTSIALLPVLFLDGIGNDLQKPLSIVIIGGLTIGTFFTTWFIPLAYWYVAKWKNKLR